MVELDIQGMTCDHCAHAVRTALSEVPGVVSAQVSLRDKRAQVEGDVDVQALVKAVVEEGYQAFPRK